LSEIQILDKNFAAGKPPIIDFPDHFTLCIDLSFKFCGTVNHHFNYLLPISIEIEDMVVGTELGHSRLLQLHGYYRHEVSKIIKLAILQHN
jgi:hypothetical protein